MQARKTTIVLLMFYNDIVVVISYENYSLDIQRICGLYYPIIFSSENPVDTFIGYTCALVLVMLSYAIILK